MSDWIQRAVCKNMDTALFFPEQGVIGREAKAACRICPVRAECLDYALRQVNLQGIWAGTTERDRRKLRKRRRKAKVA